MKALRPIYSLFENYAREAFKYLEDDYGFKLVRAKRDGRSLVILYMNSVTGVEIEFEPSGSAFWIMLYRLVNGKMPEYQSVWDLDSDATNRFDLDTLIRIKAPWLLTERTEIGRHMQPENLEATLAERAAALHQLGEGILKGDFADFEGLSRIKQERINTARHQ